MILCDVCLEPTRDDELLDCADPGTQHCGACAARCAPCMAAHADDYAAEVALERCEQ